MGPYRWGPYWQDRGKDEFCGKRATFVANYPNLKPSYFCTRHAKTRSYITKL